MWGNDADYLPISPVMVGSPLRTNPRGHIHKNVLALGRGSPERVCDPGTSQCSQACGSRLMANVTKSVVLQDTDCAQSTLRPEMPVSRWARREESYDRHHRGSTYPSLAATGGTLL